MTAPIRWLKHPVTGRVFAATPILLGGLRTNDLVPCAGPEEASQTPSRLEQIVAAIDRIDSDAYTRDGVPRVEALEAILGFDISAAERSAAYDTYCENSKER